QPAHGALHPGAEDDATDDPRRRNARRRNARWRRHAADARNGRNARWRRGPQEEGRGEEEGPQGRSVRQPGQAGAGGEGAGGQEGRQDQGSGRLGLRRRRPGQGRGIRSGEPAERLRRNLPRWQEVAPYGTIDSCTFALGACPLNRAEVIVRATASNRSTPRLSWISCAHRTQKETPLKWQSRFV